MPARPLALAAGVVAASAAASILPLGRDPVPPAAAAVAATGVLFAAAAGTLALRRRRLASTLSVASLGAALVAARLAVGLLALPPPSSPAALPSVLPRGDGPWQSTVVSAHLSRGRQVATLDLGGGVACAAILPADPRLLAGDRIEWSGRVEAIADDDYGRYLADQGMAASCEADAFEVLGHDESAAGRLEQFRQASGDAVQLVIPEPAGGLAAAILVGLRDRVDRDVATSFTAAGVSHIVAISGWNIAIVAASVALLLRGRLRRRPRAAITIGAIVAYTLFAGASASVVRAAAMALVAVGAVESGRGARVTVGLAWAAVAMLLADPHTIADVGFLLSATATMGLIAWATPIARRLERAAPRIPAAVRESLAISTAAQMATLPLVLTVFGRLALISPATNLAAVPLVPPAMALGLVAMAAGWLQMLGAPPVLCGLAALPAALLLNLLIAIVGVAAAVPGASQTVPPPWNVAAALGCGAAIAGVWRRAGSRPGTRAATPARSRHDPGGGGRAAPKPTPGRPGGRRRRVVVGIAGVAVVVAASVATAAPDGRLHVVVLDVGQGDAILLEGDRGGRILVDGGPDGGVLLTELDGLIPSWDRRLDAVVLTHPHDDHVAGLVSVLSRYRVGAAYESGRPSESPEYVAWKRALSARSIPVSRLSTGQTLRLDDAALRVLWPDDGTTRPAFLDPSVSANRATNDSSIVLLGEFEGRRFLLTGDAEDDVDPTLVARGLPHVDVLKVAHHGSATASSDSLLAALTPGVAIVSVGADNSYGHPAATTLRRLLAHAGRVTRTDRSGTIDVAMDRAGVAIRASRDGDPKQPATGRARLEPAPSVAAALLYDSGDVRAKPPRKRGAPALARSTALAPAPLARRRRDGRLAGDAGHWRRAAGRSPPGGGGGAAP